MNWFFIILFTVFIHSGDDHDIHLSVCDIKTTENNHLEIKLKIFYDDLQTSMNLTPGEEIPKKYKGADDLINNFVQKNFSIYIDGHKKSLEYVKSESALPAIWTTMKLKNDVKINCKIKIQNTILTTLYDDQVNIINVDIFQHKETYKMDSKNKVVEFTINQ